MRRKNGPKFFLHWKVAFFSKLCVFNNLLGLKKCCYKFQSKCQIILWTLLICSLMFFILDNTRKNRPKTFAIAKKVFLKCLFLSTSWVPKKCYHHLHNQCQNTLLTLILCSLSFFMFNKTRKKILKPFLRWKVCIFFSKHCFSNNLLGSQKGFYRFTRICRISLWTLIKRWVTFVMFDKTRKIRPKAISDYKDCLFSPKLRVFNNLLVLEKTHSQVQE